MTITGRHVQRLTQEVGADLARQRDEQAAHYRRRELPPRVTEPPPVAVVEVDGGRLGTRQAGAGPGVHQPQAKEDKIACLVSMRSDTHAADPQPEPPPGFRDARRVARLVRQFQGQAASPADTPAAEPAADAEPAATDAVDRPDKPERLVRTCVATYENSRAFGPLVAAEAQRGASMRRRGRRFWGTASSTTGRSSGPGSRTSWPSPTSCMSCVICTGRPGRSGATTRRGGGSSRRWMTACWQGRVAQVLAELAAWQERLGRPPPEDDGGQDARRVLAEVLCYLGNNRERMDYPRYRQEGLPVTSSWVESLVGEFNGRVKGRDKYWNRSAGAEAILQVRAAVLIGGRPAGRGISPSVRAMRIAAAAP